jgi:hypothetical protein
VGEQASEGEKRREDEGGMAPRVMPSRERARAREGGGEGEGEERAKERVRVRAMKQPTTH